MTATAHPFPDLEDVIEPDAPPPPADEATGWRRLHEAVGLETFGRPAGPWGALFAPLPLAAAALLATKALLWPAATLPWLADRVGEALYLLAAPFLLATLWHALARSASEAAWKASQGTRHLDWSPRVRHYLVALAVAAVPLLVLQLSAWALDRWLDLALWVQGLGGVAHVGYDPGLSNMFTLIPVFPLVWWQAARLVAAVPAGRLLGMQRELARLRGALAWGPEAWGLAVGEAIDRWLADLAPGDGEAPLAGEGRRRHRQRWSALRRELVAAWVADVPDLARANRALHLYRRSR